MKQIAVGLSIATLIALGFAAQASTRAASLERERDELAAKIASVRSERDGLKQRMEKSAPRRIHKELLVQPQTIQPYQFIAPSPGTLVGTWRSSGNGTGGHDDTIQQFRLTDPGDALLESSEYHTSSGRFMVTVRPGAHTFFFDNSGLFRGTARRVFIEAEFRPE